MGTSSTVYAGNENAITKTLSTVPSFLYHKRLPKKNASLLLLKRNQQQPHHNRHPKRNHQHHRTSKRETKLLKDHESSIEFLVSMEQQLKPDTNNKDNYDNEVENNAANNTDNDESISSVHHQVVLLQNLVTINKHLQREEELLLRLMTKMRNYNSNIQANEMSANQIRTAIDQINCNMNSTNTEIQRLEMELQSSQELLHVKSDVVNRLSLELEEMEIAEGKHLSNGERNLNCLEKRVMLAQAPFYFQKDDFDTATVNLHCDQRNVNKFAATGMTNAKVGPKKLINEFCKDPDLLAINVNGGDNEYTLMGTLV